MTKKLLQKRLGNFLYDNVLVPRVSKPKFITRINAGNINTLLSKYHLFVNATDPSQSHRSSVVNGKHYFLNATNTAIYQRGHVMKYKSDSAPGARNPHKKGDVRMCHLKDYDEFKKCYGHYVKDCLHTIVNNFVKQYQSSDTDNHDDAPTSDSATDDGSASGNADPTQSPGQWSDK